MRPVPPWWWRCREEEEGESCEGRKVLKPRVGHAPAAAWHSLARLADAEGAEPGPDHLHHEPAHREPHVVGWWAWLCIYESKLVSQKAYPQSWLHLCVRAQRHHACRAALARCTCASHRTKTFPRSKPPATLRVRRQSRSLLPTAPATRM